MEITGPGMVVEDCFATASNIEWGINKGINKGINNLGARYWLQHTLSPISCAKPCPIGKVSPL